MTHDYPIDEGVVGLLRIYGSLLHLREAFLDHRFVAAVLIENFIVFTMRVIGQWSLGYCDAALSPQEADPPPQVQQTREGRGHIGECSCGKDATGSPLVLW